MFWQPIRSVRDLFSGVLMVVASQCVAQFDVDSVERLLSGKYAPLEHLKLLRQLSKADDPAIGGKYSLATVRYADSLLENGHAGDFAVLTQKGGGLWNYGRHFDRQGLKDSAMTWYERGAAQWRGISDRERTAFADQYLAEQKIDRGLPRDALDHLHNVIAFRRSNADTAGMIAAYSAMGLAHYSLGDPSRALEHETLALRLAERIGMERSVGQNLLNIGLIYQDQQETDTALACYHRSVRAFQRAGDPVGTIAPINNAALIRADRDELPQAMELCRKGLAIAPAAEFPVETSILTSTLGVVYRLMGDHHQAIRYGEEAVANAAQSPIADHRATVLINLGRSLHAAGKDARALAIAKQAQALFDQRDLSVHRRMYLADLFTDIYTRTGPPEQALAHLREFVLLKDSVANKEIRDRLRRAELARQSVRDSVEHAGVVERLEHARAMEGLRADRNRDRALLLGLGALLLIGGGTAFFVLDRKRRKARFDKEAAQLETQALRSQMNPHFIFNALNSINAFVQKNDADQAGSFLTKFARLMRLVLENSRQSEVPLKDDLEALDAYLHLERVRSGEKFDYTITVDPAIDQEETMVPPLVVQPFVENAIWHGMAGVEGKGHITLSVTRRACLPPGTGDELVMAIEDNGVGRHVKKQDPASGEPVKKTSLATTITRARLDLVQKQRGRPAGFTYTDLPKGTRVELNLPI